MFWRIQPGLFPVRDCDANVFGVPAGDDGGEQVEPGDPEVLPFGCAISDFFLSTDPQCNLQGMIRLAFIEADIGATLHIGIEQPVYEEQPPLAPPDFAKSNGQAMLSRPRRQFLQKPSQLHPA